MGGKHSTRPFALLAVIALAWMGASFCARLDDVSKKVDEMREGVGGLGLSPATEAWFGVPDAVTTGGAIESDIATAALFDEARRFGYRGAIPKAVLWAAEGPVFVDKRETNARAIAAACDLLSDFSDIEIRAAVMAGPEWLGPPEHRREIAEVAISKVREGCE